ncbi:MAG: hypothetical protein WDW38_009968 [Sanguina aurantia]
MKEVIDRTVSINVFKGEVLEDSLEEVVQYRQFTVQQTSVWLLAAAAADEQHTSHGDLWRMVAVLRRLCPDLLCTVCRSARPCQCSATDTLDHRNAAARACCTGAPCDTWVGGLVISERAPLRQLQLLAAAA